MPQNAKRTRMNWKDLSNFHGSYDQYWPRLAETMTYYTDMWDVHFRRIEVTKQRVQLKPGHLRPVYSDPYRAAAKQMDGTRELQGWQDVKKGCYQTCHDRMSLTSPFCPQKKMGAYVLCRFPRSENGYGSRQLPYTTNLRMHRLVGPSQNFLDSRRQFRMQPDSVGRERHGQSLIRSTQ